MKTLSKILLVAIALVMASATTVSAAAGDLFLDRGTVYFVNYLGQKRGFPSADVFFSHGFNFSQVRAATSADLVLPEGPVMTFPEGTLVKSRNSATVYLIKGGQKRAFTSGSIFLSAGYSFSNILTVNQSVIAGVPDGGAFSAVAGANTSN